MDKYFTLKLEYNKEIIYQKINETISSQSKGYVCVVDGNVLATAHKFPDYRVIINEALVNICDGSSIALLAGLIHKTSLTSFTGPELFSELVGQNFKQYFIGNTPENLILLKTELNNLNYNSDNYKFMNLPFNKVDEFDYKKIAEEVNLFSPDIIWISLGAPKQERFIAKLFPYINKGVLIAIGAAFNLFLGVKENQRAPLWMRKLHLEWLYRVIKEPKRVGKRAFSYLLLLPQLIIEEIVRTKIKK